MDDSGFNHNEHSIIATVGAGRDAGSDGQLRVRYLDGDEAEGRSHRAVDEERGGRRRDRDRGPPAAPAERGGQEGEAGVPQAHGRCDVCTVTCY